MKRQAVSFRSRQFLLFVIAIVLPCALLVILTVRMLVQDRELADKRVGDERRRLASEARQVLLAKVERLRLSAGNPSAPAEPEVVLIAEIEHGRVTFSWESVPQEVEGRPFTELVRQGEQLEFAASRFAYAAAAYQQAARSAKGAGGRALADLHTARAFAKAGRSDDAERVARGVLAQPAALGDDQGIPFALYAAKLLAGLPGFGDARAIGESLDRVVAQPSAGPAAMYMARDLARSADNDHDRPLLIDRRLNDLERALQLKAALPTLGSASTAANPVWATFGPPDDPWLVHVTSIDAEHGRLIALRGIAVMADLPALVTVGVSAEGESLAPTFPSLRATLPPAAADALAAEAGARRPFYLAALVLVVGVAFTGAYLFWRDADRDVRTAAMRSQFVSSVSHELKTPLTAIRMFAETLLMGRTAEPQVQAEYLQTIVSESERLTRLLNNVLDFSKIESGGKTYHLESHSLADVVRTAARAVHYPFSQHGFDLSVSIDEAVPSVPVDADAIEQAILNLLSNAMKYSGDARLIRLTLVQAGDHAEISVADRGIGIPVEEHRRVFDKFYRVRNAATDRVTGAGLGLTLVDHVIRGHGGHVTLRSAPGEGSTFTLHLPLTAAGQPHTADGWKAGITNPGSI